MRSRCHGQRTFLIMQLNLRLLRRIELYTKVCTVQQKFEQGFGQGFSQRLGQGFDKGLGNGLSKVLGK